MTSIKQQIQNLQRRLEELRRVGAELEAELAALNTPTEQIGSIAAAGQQQPGKPARTLESYLGARMPSAGSEGQLILVQQQGQHHYPLYPPDDAAATEYLTNFEGVVAAFRYKNGQWSQAVMPGAANDTAIARAIGPAADHREGMRCPNCGSENIGWAAYQGLGHEPKNTCLNCRHEFTYAEAAAASKPSSEYPAELNALVQQKIASGLSVETAVYRALQESAEAVGAEASAGDIEYFGDLYIERNAALIESWVAESAAASAKPLRHSSERPSAASEPGGQGTSADASTRQSPPAIQGFPLPFRHTEWEWPARPRILGEPPTQRDVTSTVVGTTDQSAIEQMSSDVRDWPEERARHAQDTISAIRSQRGTSLVVTRDGNATTGIAAIMQVRDEAGVPPGQYVWIIQASTRETQDHEALFRGIVERAASTGSGIAMMDIDQEGVAAYRALGMHYTDQKDSVKLYLTAEEVARLQNRETTTEDAPSVESIMAMLRDLQAQVSEAEQRNAQLRGELGKEK